jgi:uncharacterized protein
VIVGAVSVVVGCVAVLYIGFGALLYSMQDAMIFPIPGGISDMALDEAAQEVGAAPFRIETEDGVSLYGWYRSGGGDRAVLYFHGNGATVLGTAGLMRQVNAAGWDFAVIAYRGYPGSEGAPSEEGLRRDARALWDHMIEDRGIPSERMVVHGRSLGGGVAAGLASDVTPAGLVLESTFTSLLEMAESQNRIYPVEYLLKHPFNTRNRAPSVEVPVLVMHSDGDQIIPVSHGRTLAPLFAESTYVEIPGRGHNEGLIIDCPQGRTAYLGFLADRVGDSP